jgi:hypothetical protein
MNQNLLAKDGITTKFIEDIVMKKIITSLATAILLMKNTQSLLKNVIVIKFMNALIKL